VLELIKLNRIAAVQDDQFGQIMVEPRAPDEKPDAEPVLVEGELL
jgi:chromatin segregation and condensation protein Rec8/ScpA/Scc1 (kleisin family)